MDAKELLENYKNLELSEKIKFQALSYKAFDDEDKISISIASTVFKSPGIYTTESEVIVFRHVDQKIVCV